MEKKMRTPQPVQAAQFKSESDKQRPVYEVKLPFNGGLLLASIWQHAGDREFPRYSVTLSHAHKDASGKWTYGNRSFTRDQLLGLVRVIEVAHGHIVTGNFDDEGENI